MDSMVKLMKGPKKTDKAQATLDMTQVKPVETKPIETAKPQETATITPVIKEKPAKKSSKASSKPNSSEIKQMEVPLTEEKPKEVTSEQPLQKAVKQKVKKMKEPKEEVKREDPLVTPPNGQVASSGKKAEAPSSKQSTTAKSSKNVPAKKRGP